MKILVFSDFHGSMSAYRAALAIARKEQPNGVALCGDLFGGFSSDANAVAEAIQSFDAQTYLIRGNNDRPYDEALLPFDLQDYELTYKFGRTIMFTHGHRYNGWNVPPILGKGDALVFGHTHVCSLRKLPSGIFSLNVGSIALPRDGAPSYLVLDDDGITAKTIDGQTIYFLPWQ